MKVKIACWYLFFCSTVAHAQVNSFDCRGANVLVNLISSGVDNATQSISESDVSFIYGTIGGWVCLPDPLDMAMDGVPYLKNISCHFSEGSSAVSEEDFSRAGQDFQNSIRSLFTCFDGKILNTMPRRYNSPSRGEHVAVHLDVPVHSSFDANGDPLVNPVVFIDYGYVKADSEFPIYWSLTVTPQAAR